MFKWNNLLFVVLLYGAYLPAYGMPSQADINKYKQMEYGVCDKQCYADRESCFAQSRSFARNRAEWQSMDIACFQQKKCL